MNIYICTYFHRNSIIYLTYEQLWLTVEPQVEVANRQQTPKPEAQLPAELPPSSEHSKKKYILFFFLRNLFHEIFREIDFTKKNIPLRV